MASSYTTRLRAEKQGTGENSGTWGTKLNTLISEVMEESIAGVAIIAMSDANYTLTVANGSTDEARKAVIKLTGALTATRNVICPAVEKLYMVWNNTTGGQSIAFKTSAGTGITIPNGRRRLLFCDGTNVLDLFTDLTATTTLNGTALTSTFQAADAGLTSLSGLTYVSGTPVIQATANDTFALTLSPSVTQVSANNATSATAVAGDFVNSFDSASVIALTIEGDRATPTASDSVAFDWRLSNSAGTQTIFTRQQIIGTTLTAGAEVGQFRWSLINGGSLTATMRLLTTALIPDANDLIALGAGNVSWSDLFLASGGVINWNNGNVTLTHAAGSLTLAGGPLTAPSFIVSSTSVPASNGMYQGAGNTLAFATAGSARAQLNFNAFSPASDDLLPLGLGTAAWSDLFLASGGVINWANGTVTLTQASSVLTLAGAGLQAQQAVSSETGGTLTAVSRNKKVNLASDPTINTGVFAADDFVKMYAGAAGRTITQGAGVTMRLGGTATTGSRTLAARGVAYLEFVSASEVVVWGAGVT